LDSRAGWMKGGDNGPAVIPGDAEASLLTKAVRYTDPKLQMPPDHPLPQKAIVHFEEWVRMGAPDPRDDDSQQSSEKLNSGAPSDPGSGRQHWAFRPLTNPRPPVVQASDWPETA